MQNHSSLKSSGAPFIFYLFAWLGSVCLAAWARKAPVVLALGGLLGPFLSRFVRSLLKKYDLPDRLERHHSCVWLVFVFSAAVPASMSLAQLNHVMSILPIIIYGGIFGWFGPEVLPRVFPGSSLPVLLPGSHLLITLSLYVLSETHNSALEYLIPDWVIVVFLSYLACYVMLVSRCALKSILTT